MHVIETIQIHDTARLVVYPDLDASNPREDWDSCCWETGFVNIEHAGDSRRVPPPAVHDDPTFGQLERAVQELGYLGQAHGDYSYDENPVLRWLRIFYPDTLFEYDHTYGGFWHTANAIDPFQPDVTPQKVIAAERETYRQWAEGEVCGVVLERLVTWVRQDSPDTQESRWEDTIGGALWGCYLDEMYTAQQVALEHFELTEQERVILGGGES